MMKTWQIKRLGDVLLIERGGSPRPIKKYITNSPNGLNWIKISDATASDKYIYETKEKITKEGLSKTRFVEEGDFILSNSMSFGRPYIMKTTGCIHDGWLVLKQKEYKYFETEFLYYLLSSPFIFNQFDGLAAGSTVRNLNIRLVSSVKVPIPPLPEQHRIVSILDHCFKAIDKAKANAEQNLLNAKELFESYLQGVFDAKKSDDCGWIKNRLEALGVITSTKRIYKREYVENGIPFYRTKEVKELAHNREISLELFISRERYEEIKNAFGVPQIGDLLISAVGTIGEILVIKDAQEFYFKDGNIIWLKDFHNIDTDYLKYALTAFVEKIKSLAIGSAYSALTIEKLKLYEIAFPETIEKQQKIVQKLDALQAESLKLQSHYQNKIDDLEELKKSILQKAFAGELKTDKMVEEFA